MTGPQVGAAEQRLPRIFSRNKNEIIAPTRAQGVGVTPFSDLYYYLMSASWLTVLLLFLGVFTGVNAVFALLYMWSGGITNVPRDHFLDAFFFSVQTLGTIGYGSMSPETLSAHLVVTAESMVGILGLAILTGFLFAKFSRPTARVIFSDVAVITRRNGRPALMFRVGNERGNHVVEATLRATIIHTVMTQEGERLRQMDDLQLFRSQSPAFVLTWTAIHIIDEKSPLFGANPESLHKESAEILVTLSGIDGTLSQSIHARHSFIADEIRWGHRFEDIFAFDANGLRTVDYTQFHVTREQPGEPLYWVAGNPKRTRY